MNLLKLSILFTFAVVLFMNTSDSIEARVNPRYEMTVMQFDSKTQKDTLVGKIVLELFPDKAPKHVQNFDSLVAAKFYDGLAFHRVIPDFMIQGGDPNTKNKPKETWGMGAPGQTKVPAEFNDIKHVPGILSAARSNDPNSATSQFFLMHGVSTHLDGKYTAYGQAVSGLEVIDKVAKVKRDGKDNPLDRVSFSIVKIK